MLNKLLHAKDIIWALAIFGCCILLVIGVLVTTFIPYTGPRGAQEVDFGKLNIVDIDSGSDSTSGSGNLRMLGETADAGNAYLSRLTFLCDSTVVGMRDINLVDATVWSSDSGFLPLYSYSTWNILYSDSSRISPADAVAVQKPPALVLMVGSDALPACDRSTFITSYQALINSLKASYPAMKIICCSLTPITSAYETGGERTNSMIADANEWLKQVCASTDCYYCDTASAVSSNSVLLSEFAASDGMTLNIGGINQILSYLRTHALSF